MALREDFEKLGNFFFRWRSYFPLVLGFLFLIAIKTVWHSMYPNFWDRAWEFFALFIAMLGLLIRMYVVGCVPRNTSGRNVSEQRAAVLNTTGIYSLVRHPLYLGNFLMWTGPALFVGSWWLVLAVAFIFWFYYEKIMYAEEEFLRRQFGETFTNWADRTPVFFPYRLAHWKAPELQFKFKNALRREYSGFFGTISVFSVIKLFQDRLTFGRFVMDPVWGAIFLIGLVIYVTLLTLKRRTHLLDVEGR
jgi:protein-S-isoprenylcysteine O-methyltransferase Ste14